MTDSLTTNHEHCFRTIWPNGLFLGCEFCGLKCLSYVTLSNCFCSTDTCWYCVLICSWYELCLCCYTCFINHTDLRMLSVPVWILWWNCFACDVPLAEDCSRPSHQLHQNNRIVITDRPRPNLSFLNSRKIPVITIGAILKANIFCLIPIMTLLHVYDLFL